MSNQKQFDKLCTVFRNKGFIELSKNQNEVNLIEQALEASSKLFQLPVETKQSYSPSATLRHGDGWSMIRKQQNVERWHLSENISQSMWPQDLEDELRCLMSLLKFSKRKVLNFTKSLASELTDQILLDELLNCTVRLRLLYYKKDNGLRMRPHIDSGVLTLFSGESANGLQYKDINDGMWKNVELDSHWIIGCANTLSKVQAIPAFEHRVLPSPYATRYSIAIFFHVDKGKYGTLPK